MKHDWYSRYVIGGVRVYRCTRCKARYSSSQPEPVGPCPGRPASEREHAA